MKLNDVRPTVETSGEMEEQFFSIQDTGMIFDILRNKMYSNPVMAICREISCNARDAHREVGKADVPCQITLPNYFDSFLKIKDFGPGISPDRMSNIFIKYTASTKRNDNVQTGGFGLGAKTPFSYSDTFTIETVYNGVKYAYACYIDETKIGKLNLMNKENVDGVPNGTEICIPVQSKDFQAFYDAIEFVTRHWDVKPVIKGETLEYRTPTPVFQGKDWFISAENRDSYNHGYNGHVKIIVDGIEYPLSINQLKLDKDTQVLMRHLKGTVYLIVGIGKLSLAANRESVHLDESTTKEILDRLHTVSQELHKAYQATIDTLPSYWDACVYFSNQTHKCISSASTYFKDVTWNGKKLINNHVYLKDLRILQITKTASHSKSQYARHWTHSLHFAENSRLFINDLTVREVTGRHVGEIFNKDPSLKTIMIFTPNMDATKNIETIIKDNSLDGFTFAKLSTEAKLFKGRTQSDKPRLLLFKFEGSGFKQTSYAAMEEDNNKKILARLVRDVHNPSKKYPLIKDDHAVNVQALNYLALIKDYSIYGVDEDVPDERVEEEFEDILTLKEYIDKHAFKNCNFDFAEIKYAVDHCHYNDYSRRNLQGNEIHIKDPNSLFMKAHNASQKLMELKENASLLHMYEVLVKKVTVAEVNDYINKNPDMDLKKIKAQVEKEYPLLRYMQTYSQCQIKMMINYVNLVDRERMAAPPKVSKKKSTKV